MHHHYNYSLSYFSRELAKQDTGWIETRPLACGTLLTISSGAWLGLRAENISSNANYISARTVQ